MEKQAERALIIYNLQEDFNEQELRATFEIVGEIEEFKKYQNKNLFPFLKENESDNIAVLIFKDSDNVESAFMYQSEQCKLYRPTTSEFEQFYNPQEIKQQEEEKHQFEEKQFSSEVIIQKTEVQVTQVTEKVVERVVEKVEENFHQFLIPTEVKSSVEAEQKVQEKPQEKVQEQKIENYQMEIMQKLQNINVPALKPLKKNDYFQHVIKSNYLLFNFLAWFVIWWTIFK